MTIRSRLLLLLLPPLTAFLILISLFFYFNWSREILDSFKSRLQSIVVATAQSISRTEIEWMDEHLKDPDLKDNPRYLSYRQEFVALKQKLPIANLYIVQIEPVQEGELILLNEPENPLNQIHTSQDPQNAYRQIFLLDASDSKQSPVNAPGDYDFSETDEHLVYFTKKAFVTPIYLARRTNERFMSAYAPILNKEGEVLALLGADVGMEAIDNKLHNALFMIISGDLVTLFLVVLTVFLIAEHISQPVRTLNQAALEIAAGDYDANIQVKGPKEIVELANTLNIMSECLVENISRLRESSLIRERMYGEYECALLLQHYMLQKVVEDFKNPHMRMRLISVGLANNQKGLLLKTEKIPGSDLSLTLIEAKDPSFSSLFELNQEAFLPLDQQPNARFMECHFLKDYSLLRYHLQKLFSPLVWSIKSQQFIRGSQQEIPLQNQDMVFLYNSGLIEQFETEEKIISWLTKVLKHFSEDGLDIIHTMLTNELNFLAKKHLLKRNCQIIVLQIKIPEILL
ncbi:methyl-accepting chemotaxis protein [Candidatus Protochlamydia phocaeensis]|uniref:methyl-accepting chemotaxis protein n=1 Tax=Candidatus Protochlamydia phocaeensis TaxID=1414722 RepID=UPI0008397E6C|nr:HAMP domain-containing protein [Candidatus Protochlamydia phocaeensis]